MAVREIWQAVTFLQSPSGLTVTPAASPGTELDATNFTTRRNMDFSRFRARRIYCEVTGKISAGLASAKFKVRNLTDGSDYTTATVMNNTTTTQVLSSQESAPVLTAAKNLALFFEGDGAKIFTLYNATLYIME